MVGSQILLKQAIVRWTESGKAFSQCSEVVILFYWGGGNIVIWALKDLNDKPKASPHLYTTFDGDFAGHNTANCLLN